MNVLQNTEKPRGISRERIFKRDQHTCIYCGVSPISTPGVVLHLDHVVPVVYGGSNTASNVVTACSGCNLAKRDDVNIASKVLPIISTRNEDWSIDGSRPVATVREKNDPRKIVSIRLSEADEQYCKDNGESCGSFIRSLIGYHRKESHRRAAEEERLKIVIEIERKSAQESINKHLIAAQDAEMKSREAIEAVQLKIEEVKNKAEARIDRLLKHEKRTIEQRKASVERAKPKPKVIQEFDFEESVRDLLEL